MENYYSRNAFDYIQALERAKAVLVSYDSSSFPSEISYVLEIYNISLLIKGEAAQIHVDNFNSADFKEVSRSLMSEVAKFFSQINENNIISYADDCYYIFWDDFCDLLVKFKVYKQIARFPWIAKKCKITLYQMLQYKELVHDLDADISQYMRESSQTADVLIDYYLRKHNASNKKLYIPDSFTAEDKKSTVNAYIQGQHVNANILTLIIEAPKGLNEFPIDDRMKLAAEKRIQDIFNGKTENIIVSNSNIEISISFCDGMKDVVTRSQSQNRFNFEYSSDWIRENQDYPTLLNNFIYMFEYVDLSMRCNFVETASSRGAIEDSFLVKGVKSYIHGQYFRMMNNFSTMQIAAYYNFLDHLGIALEDIVKWFFETYLKDEFNAIGFICNMPKHTDDYLTKCKMIVSAMDGVAKQYRMYLEDGCIDRELYERSSEHIVFDMLGSFQKKKYIYCNDDKLREAQFLLFSDQAIMGCTEKTQSKYNTFFELISHEEMKREDFNEFQKNYIDKLIANDVIIIENEVIHFNPSIVRLVYEFYHKEVICYNYSKCEILEQWIAENKVLNDNKLFSRNESNYINFMLNQAEFSNGLDLRNRYTHDTCSTNEKVHKSDYFMLLKIMILFVIKINEEFCLKSES